MITLKSIMLVEDDPKDIELTLRSLAECNLANRVLVVRDGAEALDYLYRRGQYADYPEGNPVIILLDLKLPKVDGFEVLRIIRSDDKLKSIPVTILTSSHEDSDLIKGYDFGVNAYIVKPIDYHQFTDAIKKLGIFWAVLNEPPLGCVKKERNMESKMDIVQEKGSA
jgi:CheY-like chemotaxis protein